MPSAMMQFYTATAIQKRKTDPVEYCYIWMIVS